MNHMRVTKEHLKTVVPIVAGAIVCGAAIAYLATASFDGVDKNERAISPNTTTTVTTDATNVGDMNSVAQEDTTPPDVSLPGDGSTTTSTAPSSVFVPGTVTSQTTPPPARPRSNPTESATNTSTTSVPTTTSLVNRSPVTWPKNVPTTAPPTVDASNTVPTQPTTSLTPSDFRR